jgi:hypothetical protein
MTVSHLTVLIDQARMLAVACGGKRVCYRAK